jgi:hypothetical protein
LQRYLQAAGAPLGGKIDLVFALATAPARLCRGRSTVAVKGSEGAV